MILQNQQQYEYYKENGDMHKALQTLLKQHVYEGMTGIKLDEIAYNFIVQHNAKPSFKGYSGYPNTICVMRNDEVVHAIPNNIAFKKGDLITIDAGIYYNNVHTDAAFSMVIGGYNADNKRQDFCDNVYTSLQMGMNKAITGNTLGDIGSAIEASVKGFGYYLCKEYCGHSIGFKMHEEPNVFNYKHPKTAHYVLPEGLVMCIEPIVGYKTGITKVSKDGWTVRTKDGFDALQWEHCGIVRADGFEILV